MKWVQFVNNYQKTKLGRPVMKQFVLQSCFCVLPRHNNIMTVKGFNLFDECTSRCVHLSPQEEECTSYKMYTFGSITSSQGMLTEINEGGAIAKIRISLESDTVKHLKAFRIISSKMPISILILS